MVSGDSLQSMMKMIQGGANNKVKVVVHIYLEVTLEHGEPG